MAYWDDMHVANLAEGYVLPHIIKRSLYNDYMGVRMLVRAYAGLMGSEHLVRDETQGWRAHAQKLVDEGFHVTAMILEECARRIDEVHSLPEKVWIYPTEDNQGWVFHEDGDSFPNDAYPTREEAFAAAEAQYPGVLILETKLPPYGHSPKEEKDS